jgi:HD-like signal output (HDOD) protein
LVHSEPDAQLISKLVEELSPGLSCAILDQWHFPESLSRVPQDCLDFGRTRSSPDYADVVMVARLQYLMGTDQLPPGLDFATISAFNRVELEPEIVVMDMEGSAEEIAQVQAMFTS